MKILAVFFFVLFLMACNESETSPEQTSGAPTREESVNLEKLSFEPSSFSKHISVSADKQYVRLAYGFFPDGTKFSSTAKMATIPCDFANTLPEGLNVNLNVPLTPCDKPIEIHFETDESSFTLNGIVVPVDQVAKKFLQPFGFDVTMDGVKASADQSVLSAANGKLEEYYRAAKGQ